ncbi:MAG: hypothetical protein AB8C84_06680 [Oligoflexales bacterium]
MDWVTKENILLASFLIALFLWFVWILRYSFIRGSLALLCRIIWMSPLIMALFPQTEMRKKSKTFHHQLIQILVDDSKSMHSYRNNISEIKRKIEKECRSLGCKLDVQYLSQLTQSNDQSNFTLLNQGLESWFFQIGADPWILMTDGGDAQPTLPWDSALLGVGHNGKMSKGLILYPNHKKDKNVTLENLNMPPFAFEGQNIPFSLVLKRSSGDIKQKLQISVEVEEKRLLTKNIVFPLGQKEMTLELESPPLSRGQHLINVEVLPTSGEKVLWDNVVHHSVEVMPNTVGILHLLGAPSWDGRYLRRYFKSEPKYDLISFFILRDPWDSQQVNERELSLIPFPVSRLFNEELPNFRVIVLQNFSLLQFLLPEYQQNLVDFVKNGGGLLFLGGDRSLIDGDLYDSPLREILPFESSRMTSSQDDFTVEGEEHGPWYDSKQNFKVGFSNPTADQRSLADVYSSWENISSSLQNFDTGKGLHHMEQVKFRDGEYTPLLKAITPQGESPLAVASYPGKGRALWIFSDSMWRMATNQPQVSRTAYSKFMNSALKWLLREEMSQPIVISDIALEKTHKGVLWSVLLRGPASRYFQANDKWNMMVCGVQIDLNKSHIENISMNEKRVSGDLSLYMQGGDRCKVDIRGQHEAFGSTKASMTGVFPEKLSDDLVGVSHSKIQQLVDLTRAEGRFLENFNAKVLTNWVMDHSHLATIKNNVEYEKHTDPYWFFRVSWIWMLLCFLPLEVIVRKWDQLSHQNV